MFGRNKMTEDERFKLMKLMISAEINLLKLDIDKFCKKTNETMDNWTKTNNERLDKMEKRDEEYRSIRRAEIDRAQANYEIHSAQVEGYLKALNELVAKIK